MTAFLNLKLLVYFLSVLKKSNLPYFVSNKITIWMIMMAENSTFNLMTWVAQKIISDGGMVILKPRLSRSCIFITFGNLWSQSPENILKCPLPHQALSTSIFNKDQIYHDLPGNIAFVSFFSTIQGSFPSSNKVITYGLGIERPAYRKNLELV